MQYNFVSIGDLNNCNADDIVGEIDLNLLSFFRVHHREICNFDNLSWLVELAG